MNDQMPADFFNDGDDPSPQPMRPWVIFDCETTGLPKGGKGPDGNPWPADHPDQPRLVSLAMIRTTPALAVVNRQHWFIQPDGWVSEPGALKVHGLTEEFLRNNGVPIADVLDVYQRMITEGHTLCAYNAVFDLKIMRGELRRAGRSDYREQTPYVCAMQSSAGVVKAKKANGQPKTPRLAEAASHFKIEEIAPHTAIGDATTCLGILRMLVQIGIDLTPKIVKAKGVDEVKA